MQLQKPEPLQHPPLPVDASVTLEVGGGEVSQLSVTPFKCHLMRARVAAGYHDMSQSVAHAYMRFHTMSSVWKLISVQDV